MGMGKLSIRWVIFADDFGIRYILFKLMKVKQTMNRTISIALNTFILGFLVVSTTVNASSTKLADAITVYYSGLPDQAIAMIRPLAQSGDSKAQLLLGNILHSLSRSNTSNSQEDPVTWYQMAAAQGSPEANYLLGVIYHNRWTESQEKGSDTIAISYYETASKLGNKAAHGPLIQIKYRDKKARKKSKATLKPKLKAIEAPTQKVVMPMAIERVESPEETAVLEKKTITTAETLEKSLPTAAVVEKIAEKLTVDEPEILEIVQANNTSDADEVLRHVYLEDVITECKKYTQAGFGYYAESINGAHLTGAATIRSIEPDKESNDSLIINLVKKQLDIELLLSIKGVPSATGKHLKELDIFGVSGIVGHAQKTQKNCEIDLFFKPIKLKG